MTTYRVGERGATVFDSEGKVVRRLPAGSVVVEGTPEEPGSLAQQYHDGVKMRRGYADKKLRPAEDKGVQPLRAAIKRLDRATARIQEARRGIRQR